METIGVHISPARKGGLTFYEGRRGTLGRATRHINGVYTQQIPESEIFTPLGISSVEVGNAV